MFLGNRVGPSSLLGWRADCYEVRATLGLLAGLLLVHLGLLFVLFGLLLGRVVLLLRFLFGLLYGLLVQLLLGVYLVLQLIPVLLLLVLLLFFFLLLGPVVVGLIGLVVLLICEPVADRFANGRARDAGCPSSFRGDVSLHDRPGRRHRVHLHHIRFGKSDDGGDGDDRCAGQNGTSSRS